MHWLAPAKINLSLRIIGRRADGFHDLRSLMVPVSVFDKLEISAKENGDLEFSCSTPGIPVDDSNLVVQAARLFCRSVGLLPQLRINLKKQIPHGAGLGGGSSDAATTLLALDSLFQTGLPREVLAEMGAEIGSDIPFFIYQSAAWIGGRGEMVEPVTGLPSLPILLIKPPFSVSTPWAFKHWKDSTEIPGVSYEIQKVRELELVNDLERPVFQKHLFLADLKLWLREQPAVEGALMTGSGSTLFAVLREKAAGYALGEAITQEFGSRLWLFLCETIAN
jgi:4-diphosphocytidyl-2-C-methyl-D-erythritol kinase